MGIPVGIADVGPAVVGGPSSENVSTHVKLDAANSTYESYILSATSPITNLIVFHSVSRVDPVAVTVY